MGNMLHITGCMPENWEKALRELRDDLGFTVGEAGTPVNVCKGDHPSVVCDGATYERIRWAGLTNDDFECITTYENIGYCKPKKEYYTAVANAIGVLPEECLMVGNDVDDDMPAAEFGMHLMDF